MPRLELHDYQHVAVKFLQGTPRSYLALDMGLGKTAISLSALTPDRLPALIVAPKRVAELVWPVEHEKWRNDLSFALAAGSPKERKAAMLSGADVIVLGRDNLKDVANNEMLGVFKTFVYDEASGLKGRGARWKLAAEISKQPQMENVWLLSGTPAPNGLMDLWAQYFILDFGERLGKNISTYRSRYFRPGRQLRTGTIIEWIMKPGADLRIHEAIQDISLGMSAENHLELPPVTYNNVYVSLPPEAFDRYEDMRRKLVVDMTVLGGEVHTASNAAVLSNKLQQIAAGGLYVDDAWLHDHKYLWLHNAKIDALEEILEGTGSNVLCWYNFRFEMDQILGKFKDLARVATEDGAVEAWNRGKIKLLLAHPLSASMGLNLQAGGHVMVWYTPTWSLGDYEQGIKRLVRQGQTGESVIVHHLLAIDTVDEHIMDVVEGKATIQDALRAHLESPL